MDRTLFSFIWKHSKRDQLILLGVTLITFPFLYATLELPKRIINDAIGASSGVIEVWGVALTQIQFLMLLCALFLLAVLVHGLMKMRLNTMKGVLAERLLRRFRYQLISRMLRFPQPYFRRTSQGELVSMVTSEAEPMGGLMGDAVAQPVFQAGQMLTILSFLFLQSFWFGLASVALIPLQAWLIPMLQRQINLLNKERIGQVRLLASEIGESAAGIGDLRINGGWRFRLAGFTARLGQLFGIRFRIYQKKFFMKFINNFITQLTPFFFFSVGGYLVIKGEITVGALVAALAAYKDLSSPWKELLAYYNQVQDMSLRWQIVTERFAPKNMVDEALFEGTPDDMPHLSGTIKLDNVTVRDGDGNPILENLTLEIPPASRVAIKCESQIERTALADLLTREVLPSTGRVTLSGHDLSALHQSVIAARIGYAHSRPYLFRGTLGDNLLMPLRTSPREVEWRKSEASLEAERAGNSDDPFDVDWVDPALAGLTDSDDIIGWWFQLIEAMGIEKSIFRRGLSHVIDPDQRPVLAARITDLRSEALVRLKAKGLDQYVHFFDRDQFNPGLPLGGNLLFAAPRVRISFEDLQNETGLIELMDELGLAEDALAISQAVIDTLNLTFGRDGTDHPLFQMLNIEPELYDTLSELATKRRNEGADVLTADENALMSTIAFSFSAEQIGTSFPERYKRKIVQIRQSHLDILRARTAKWFVPIEPDTYLPREPILDNVLFGKISATAGGYSEEIEEVVAELLTEHGLNRQVAATLYDREIALGGANLASTFQERIAFSRAGIKRPDILILDQALASHDAEMRSQTRERLRVLLPQTTMLFMENNFNTPEAYDMVVEIKNGRIGASDQVADDAEEMSGSKDLRRKQRIIADSDLFGKLDRKSQRLLAFSAQRYKAKAGDKIFEEGQKADAAYLCLSGKAELAWSDDEGRRMVVSTVVPGRVIGDLAIILNEPRNLTLTVVEDAKFLRIGAKEYMAVVENDATVAMSLLQTVAGHLTGTATLLRNAAIEIPKEDARGDTSPESLN